MHRTGTAHQNFLCSLKASGDEGLWSGIGNEWTFGCFDSSEPLEDVVSWAEWIGENSGLSESMAPLPPPYLQMAHSTKTDGNGNDQPPAVAAASGSVQEEEVEEKSKGQKDTDRQETEGGGREKKDCQAAAEEPDKISEKKAEEESKRLEKDGPKTEGGGGSGDEKARFRSREKGRRGKAEGRWSRN